MEEQRHPLPNPVRNVNIEIELQKTLCEERYEPLTNYTGIEKIQFHRKRSLGYLMLYENQGGRGDLSVG